MYTGRFGEAGLCKETPPPGTVATAPARFRRFIPPFNFSTDIALLIGKGVQGIADMAIKVAQGAAQLKGGKMKYELDPDEVGDDLMAAFGVDTLAETASFTVVAHTPFVVSSGVGQNDMIDFIIGTGSELHATVAAGSYDAYNLAKAIKIALDAAGTPTTFTVAFDPVAKKFTITPSGAQTLTLLWKTGVNGSDNLGTAISALIGWGHTDTPAATPQTSTSAVTFVSSNDAIPFNENSGAEKTAYLAAGVYAMGADSSVSASLCKEIKTQLEAANGTSDAYTVAYSYSAKKFTIVNDTHDFILKFSTGTAASISAYSLMGFTAADASSTSKSLASDSTTAAFVMSHAFSRIQSASLPSYTWWQKNGPDYPQHAGCMLSKLEINVKAKEFIEVDADWLGLKYDATGTTQNATYSTLQPMKFNMCVPTVGGSPIANYDDLKITIDNQIAVEHVVGATIYGAKIYSKGLKISVSMSLIVEDLTEWAKFIAGTSTSLSLAITSTELIKAGFPYSLTLSIPVLQYSAAPRSIPGDLLKIVFTGEAVYNGIYSLLPTLVNDFGSAY